MTNSPPLNNPDDQEIAKVLRQVIDPEVGMDILSLGLVYRLERGADFICVEMTMTSPACPMGDMILNEVSSRLQERFPTLAITVNLVWEPAWSPALMDEHAKQHFGWSGA